MKISIVVPHVPFTEDHHRLLMRCLSSFRFKTQAEIIVLSDMGESGFTRKVNEGMARATGDYIMVVNNDIEWREGELTDLCVPGVVTSPVMLNQWGDKVPQRFWGCFFVVPRKVYEAIGPLDEQFFLYCSDTDFVVRCKNAGVELRSIPSCLFFTEGGQTTKEIKDRSAIDIADTEKFEKKWGVLPSQVDV